MLSVIALLPILLIVLSLSPAAVGLSASAELTGAVITGGDLPHPIKLAPVDEDAFYRRVNPPPLLSEEQTPAGPAYGLKTSYWETAIRGRRSDQPVAEDATYYPNGGFVKASQAGEAVWLVLDHRQRANIDRYIRLGKAGLISENPSLFEVLTATAGSEEIAIDLGARALTAEEERRFWSLAARQTVLVPDTVVTPSEAGPDDAWLIFVLPEGRAVQILYRPGPGTLIDSLGEESYRVPPSWLTPVLGSDAVASVEAIPQSESAGSRLWWLLMFAMAAVSIGIALTARRLLHDESTAHSEALEGPHTL